MGITDIEFIHAEGFDSGDEARSLAISNAKSALAKPTGGNRSCNLDA